MAAVREECAQSILPDDIITGEELNDHADGISPAIPWMDKESPKANDLTIVDRGGFFSAWSEKR